MRLVLDQRVSHIVVQVQQTLLLLLSRRVEKFSFFLLVFILHKKARLSIAAVQLTQEGAGGAGRNMNFFPSKVMVVVQSNSILAPKC